MLLMMMMKFEYQINFCLILLAKWKKMEYFSIIWKFSFSLSLLMIWYIYFFFHLNNKNEKKQPYNAMNKWNEIQWDQISNNNFKIRIILQVVLQKIKEFFLDSIFLFCCCHPEFIVHWILFVAILMWVCAYYIRCCK